MHGPPNILAASVNIPHNPSMAIPVMRHHRYGAARGPTPQFLLRGAVTALATLRRVHPAQADTPLTAGESIAIPPEALYSLTP